MGSSRLSDEKPSGGDIGVVTRRFPAVHIEDKRPVFILQLESVNAMAIAGMATPGLGREELMPVLNSLRPEGVFVPFMWGSSMQTHRGRGAILCSAVLDLYAGISMGPSEPGGCLPSMLAKQGYRTIFATAHTMPSFGQSDRFNSAAGFRDSHFADYMRKNDPHYGWGYDDCIFYNRTFDYLDRHFATKMHEKFFTYLEVTANHNPFGAKRRSGAPVPFPIHSGFAERYLNSFASEDYCIATFMKRVEPYRDRAHVILVGDHSWPVGILGSKSAERGISAENFLIPFLYLPPRDAGDAYRKGVTIDAPLLGQADITPTLLELLSGKPQSNSFAALLKTPPPGEVAKLPPSYDDCQVTTQPYDGGQVAVVRGNRRLLFRLETRTVRQAEMGEDFRDTVSDERERMRYPEFLNAYLCDRFRFWVKTPKDSPRAVALKIPHYSF